MAEKPTMFYYKDRNNLICKYNFLYDFKEEMNAINQYLYQKPSKFLLMKKITKKTMEKNKKLLMDGFQRGVFMQTVVPFKPTVKFLLQFCID